MSKWNIIFAKGQTYQQTITLDGVADIASATGWSVHCAMPNETTFLEATTANGLLVAGATSNEKVMIIPAATTADFATGNGRFDFFVEWAGGVKRPYYLGGGLQVLPYVGEVTP